MKHTHKEIKDKYKEVMKEAEPYAYEILDIIKDQKVNIAIAALCACLLGCKNQDDDITLDDIVNFIKVMDNQSNTNRPRIH